MVTEIRNATGYYTFRILLQDGAELNSEIIQKIKSEAINAPYMATFLIIAYKYAKTIELKMEIDPEKAQKEILSAACEEESARYNLYNQPIVIKESGSCCTIMMINKIIYDNELLNHSKIKVMLEVAKEKSMTSELITLGEDKDIADAIIAAIAETKQKIYTELFPNDVDDDETLQEINDELENISIQQVLDILLAQAPVSSEIIPFSESSLMDAEPSIASLVSNIEIFSQEASHPGEYEEQNTHAEFSITNILNALINAAKMLEILSFMLPISGNQFIGGFNGNNPNDDLGGNGNGGGYGVILNKTPDTAEEIHGLLGNITLHTPQDDYIKVM